MLAVQETNQYLSITLDVALKALDRWPVTMVFTEKYNNRISEFVISNWH